VLPEDHSIPTSGGKGVEMLRPTTVPADLQKLLGDRYDFFEVEAIPSVKFNSGFDVVLRIDGTYADELTASGVAKMFRRKLGL